jgi:hypothetical protein
LAEECPEVNVTSGPRFLLFGDAFVVGALCPILCSIIKKKVRLDGKYLET